MENTRWGDTLSRHLADPEAWERGAISRKSKQVTSGPINSHQQIQPSPSFSLLTSPRRPVSDVNIQDAIVFIISTYWARHAENMASQWDIFLHRQLLSWAYYWKIKHKIISLIHILCSTSVGSLGISSLIQATVLCIHRSTKWYFLVNISCWCQNFAMRTTAMLYLRTSQGSSSR